MNEPLNRLVGQVRETRSVKSSSDTFVNGVANHIRENVNNPSWLRQFADQLEQGKDDITSALTENTPADEFADRELQD
jgi:hypothetical protein